MDNPLDDKDFIAQFASKDFNTLRLELGTVSGMSNNVIPDRSQPPKPFVPLESKSIDSSSLPPGRDAITIMQGNNYENII